MVALHFPDRRRAVSYPLDTEDTQTALNGQTTNLPCCKFPKMHENQIYKKKLVDNRVTDKAIFFFFLVCALHAEPGNSLLLIS